MKTKTKRLIALPKLLKKAQTVFNSWIRQRDLNSGCISCGAKVEQAGHYFSQGHYSALRFSEVNTNGQCVRCNMFLSGNLIKYRQGLIKRYGAERVELLEVSAELRRATKYTRTELEFIIEKYKT